MVQVEMLHLTQNELLIFFIWPLTQKISYSHSSNHEVAILLSVKIRTFIKIYTVHLQIIKLTTAGLSKHGKVPYFLKGKIT